MPAFGVSSSMIFERGQFLRRRVWQPLHRMMEIFHVLPLTAAILIFLLLATDRQIRELYLSYLEGPSPGQIASTGTSFVMAALGFALISAAFYEAHYWLSTLRLNVVYSSLSNPDVASKLRGLQRVAAFLLALVPWLGLTAGLFGVQRFLAVRCDRLGAAGVDVPGLLAMQYLPSAPVWVIAVATILFGLAVSMFLDRYRRHAVVQFVSVAMIPFAATGALLLIANLNPLTLGAMRNLTALACFAALSTTFWLGYYVLYVMRTGFIYAHQWRPDTGFNWRSRRRTGLVLWQLVPWVAIALYVVIVPEQAKVVAASSESGLCFPALDDLVRNPPGASRWSLIPVAMMAAMAAGLVVSIALDWHRESAKLRGTIVSSILLLMLAAAAASFRVDTIVWFYRLIGPLAALAFGLMFLFAIFTLLAVLSQKSGFPALLLVLLTVVISALFPIPIWWTTTALAAVSVVIVVMAALSRLWAVAAVGVLLVLPAVITWAEEARFVRVRAKPSAAAPALVERFEKWLAQPDRAAAISKPSKYPVFIIAVEGGGIYAATAASLFLAKLQDTDADFARHVFAISGVSGGAIGATIFQALAGSAAGSPPQDAGNASIAGSQPASADVASASDRCKRRDASARPPAAGPRLVPMVSNVMQGDHFSPVVGAIFPELLGASAGRAEALAESFKTSVQSQDDVAASELGYCFVDHWSESRGLPALVLNSTWVETGFRVAFAPFLLHGVDDSLYAFSDRHMPGDDKITLIKAAVVSARFPLILPPYSVVMEQDTVDLRWNFVDGGYSDSSGAGTALALYRALSPIAGSRNAEIRIILVTGSDPQPDLTPGKASISGTPFRDTLAPIAAVMKVRDGLGNQAVARICYDRYQSNDCRTKARGQGASLKIVEIEDDRYDLPLGWKLSRTTFEVVQWMLGRPELCEDGRGLTEGSDDQNATGEQAALERSKRTLVDNSCVLKSVSELLRAGKPLNQK